MLDFSSLSNAIASLSESITVIDKHVANNPTVQGPEYRTFRSGVIQNFDFTYELAWKAMRTWLAENIGKSVVDGITRKELFRYAAQYSLINDVVPWFAYHVYRNQTSHTYEEKTAVDVFSCIHNFHADVCLLQKVLSEKND